MQRTYTLLDWIGFDILFIFGIFADGAGSPPSDRPTTSDSPSVPHLTLHTCVCVWLYYIDINPFFRTASDGLMYQKGRGNPSSEQGGKI